MIAALPVMIAGASTDWTQFSASPTARPEFVMGADFVAANGERSMWLFTLARWACIPFSLLGGVICYLWARDLYGTVGGLLALTLWCFCPNILGHGALITPDVAATAFGLAAAYTFWRWLRRSTWTATLASGLVLGMAELTKMTLGILFGLWPILWLVYRWPQRRSLRPRDWLRELGMIAAQMLVAVYILNLGYGFEGSLTRLGDFKFVSATLGANEGQQEVPRAGGNRFADSWLADVPVPLPKNYLLGLDLQKRDFEHYHHPSYLRGQFRQRGWWYYYLYALAIKVPLGNWLLLLLAAVSGFWIRSAPNPSGLKPRVSSLARDEFVLLAPAVVILVLVSSQTGFSEHMRYVLPAFPFAFVWIGRLAPVFDRKHWIIGSAAAAALAWSIASSLWVYPHSLSYFNELVGGPVGGPRHLIHSNVDWGQDLLYLKRWLDEHPQARPIKLAYFGYFDPVHAGIEYAPPEVKRGAPIPPGWYAISVNFVCGLPYFTYQGDGTTGYLSQGALAAFQNVEPVAMAGYSIYIYHVE
jgi:4-amino-4-deoxy-L-arabinose transferase-like glycosyltransferase